MQKTIGILLLIGAMSISEIKACDICNAYLSLNPGDFRNSFGITNRLRTFETAFNYEVQNYSSTAKLSHVDITPVKPSTKSTTFKEKFVSYDVWGRVFINPRLQLALSATFTDNYHYVDDTITNAVAGIGDMQALAFYRLINTKYSMDTNKLLHRLTVGGGFKLPTGSFNKSGMSEDIDPHLQPGTGSLDYTLILEYIMRYKQVGMRNNFIYRLNSENKNGFRFADRKIFNGSIFLLLGKEKLQWMPSIGCTVESAYRDKLKGKDFVGSGGDVAFATVGLTVFAKNFSIGTMYYPKPIHEDLYDRSVQLNNNERLITELTYFFK